MKKVIAKGALIAIAGLTFSAAQAFALPAEYELINPGDISEDYNTMISTVQGANVPGYWIWTDTPDRKNFHMAWTTFSGQASAGGDNFFGKIVFENTSYTDTVEILWEDSSTGPPIYDTVFYFTNPDAINFSSWNVGGVDGLSFSLIDYTLPSYVGFDLSTFGAGVDANDGGIVNFALTGLTAESLGGDGDFALAAPVPEPATMLLFGAGLAGLAGVARRRKN